MGGGDKATHKLIIGDNYPALLNLLVSYKNKIKLIYIDPPYGKDDMGEFAKTNYNNAISRDNLLSMLYPRLQLAKELLRDDGVIFCSIDDKNQAYVKCLFDEVFEERNFVAQISWRQFHSVKNDAKNFSKNIEYILCYAKSFMENIIQNEVFDKADSYKMNDNDGKGFYKLDPVWAKSGTSTETYTFKNGRQWSPPSGTFWRYSLDTMKQMEANNEIVFNGKNPMAKRFLNNVSIGRKSSTFWDGKEVGFTLNGDSEVKNIFNGNKIFENPKPIGLLKRICEISTNKNDIILDFFAGSGTTGHACLELNREDGGNRQFILVTNNENNIAQNVTSKRLKRIMTGQCYDGNMSFKWLEKNKPYGGTLEVSQIESIANWDKSIFEKIDERLYGLESFKDINDKIKWVCENFEIAQKDIPEEGK